MQDVIEYQPVSKSSTQTTSYLPWPVFRRLISLLIRDGQSRYALIIAIGGYTGLRISDILSLKWNDLVGMDQLVIKEKKTKKVRTIYIHPELRNIINTVNPNRSAPNTYMFPSTYKQKGEPINYHAVNKRLKEIFAKYKISYSGNISSHLLRKTFGRRVFEANGESEKALIMLSQIFRHSNSQITRIYLGLQQEEINEVYLSL